MTDELVVGVVGGWQAGHSLDRVSGLLAEGLGKPSDVRLHFAARSLSSVISSLPGERRVFIYIGALSGPLWQMKRSHQRVDAVYWSRLSRELAAAGSEGALFALLRRGSEVEFEPPQEVVLCENELRWEIPPRFDQAVVLLRKETAAVRHRKRS